MTSALRHKPFALLWGGQAFSSLGDCLYAVAIATLVLQRGASPTALAVIMAARAIGTTATAALGGVLADRITPGRAMLAADIARAAVLAVLALAGSVMPVAAIAALTFATGVGEAVFLPAYMALIPLVAPPAALRSANAWTSIAQRTAQVAGPVTAGGIVAAWRPQTALGVDAFTFTASIATLAVLTRRLPAAPSDHTGRITCAEVLAGLTEMRSRPWLAATVAGSASHILFGLGPLLLLLPWLAKSHATSTLPYSMLLAAFGAGSILGTSLSTRVRRTHRGVVGQAGLATTAVAMLTLGTSAPLPCALSAMAVCGAGYSAFGVLWTTAVQEQVPAHLLGRVAAVDTSVGLGCMPLGYLLAGTATNVLGQQGTLLALAPVTATCALLPLLAKGTVAYHTAQPTSSISRGDTSAPSRATPPSAW
ncbi:MFS transporter [Streptantibioticus ferralitis]|uniref:MFS transporter n=1 Tax=Streptantibioticus ferralitis TaxID=236510 RepID=A0ABT5Z3M3_9ACTN|nr:MFS transporter [Streptantibioticus ferralitis]MDF2258426.1 MFS transporter [Streptantibioticus ferralitis]